MSVVERRVVRGADVLVDALRRRGLDTVFGLPGVQLDAAFDALAGSAGAIRVYTARNEQATSYMAEAYTRVTGRVSCCLVVPGPGILNAASGLATAYACNTPVLCVAGQIDSRGIERGLGHLHEIPHQLELLGSVTKWARRIESPARIEDTVAEAFRRLRLGRPRPVAVEVPVDVLEAEAPPSSRLDATPASAPEPDLSALDAAAEMLQAAERPLVVAGGGVLRAEAWDELRLLAERLGAPVQLTANALGALPSEHPLAFTAVTAPRMVAAADVILAVGTRFARGTAPRFELGAGQRLIRIDADREELARDVAPTIAIEADVRLPLARLAESVARSGGNGWRGLEELRDEARRKVTSLRPQAEFGAAIRAALPDDAVVIGGMTQVGYWSQVGLPVRRPRTFLGPGYQGALGFEVPAGLGAQVGSDARVVVLAGDGGFMFNVQELATAVQYRIPTIFVVFNDGAYGNVKRMQRERFGRLIASELHNPDFVRLAESFGVAGLRAGDPEALRDALGRAQAIDGPVLIEVPVGEMPSPWPLLRS